jgi:serine protease
MTRCAKVLAVLTALFLTTDATETGLRGNNGEERRRLREQELAPGTRIFARYKSKRGHRLVVSCARNVVQDDDGDDIMIIEGNGDCMHRIHNDPDIEEADFDFPVHALGRGVSERMLREVLPWGMDMINADQLPKGEHDILVCIVDSGVAVGHPDFASNRINGADSQIFFRDDWRWNQDALGHGTGVAGILAAVGGNDVGITGAGLSIYVTRGIGNDGRGYESDIMRAVQQCVTAGAKIINLSVGGSFMSVRSQRYYKQVVDEMGIMMVSAAGNDGTDAPVYPAAHPNVIAVSGVYEFGGRWGSSNYGSQIELAAPAHHVLTTGVTTSTVEYDGHAVEGYHIGGTGTETVASKLVYCGFGQGICNGAEGNICLMFRLNVGHTLESLLESCEESKGVGAIIFDPENDDLISTWTVSPDITIPAMAVTMSTVAYLYRNVLGETVVVGTRTDGTVVTYTYEEPSGTSFAAPHVSAAAALVWSHFGSACTNHQIRYALAVSAQESMNGPGCDEEYGHGIVDAKGAYDWLVSHDCSTWGISEVSGGGCTTLEGGLVNVETSDEANHPPQQPNDLNGV